MAYKPKRDLTALLAVLSAAIVWAVLKGSVDLTWRELLLAQNRQILDMRIARIALAIITGSGLAVSGAALQAILRNSLAEPYLLGTSSGAGLGAILAIMAGISVIFIPLAAFAGALLTMALVYGIARQNSRLPAQSLVLSGVIVSTAVSGVIVLLISMSDKDMLHSMVWWLWGSLAVFDAGLLLMVGLAVSVSIAAIFVLSQDLNAVSIGEDEAAHLGVRIERVNKFIFIAASFITASLICVCGMIGFVGLIIPHIMRYVVGPNHKALIPASCIGGAAFMVACDTISRTVSPPAEIPIGVITAVIGAPIFMVLLKRGQKVNQ
ncbi:MAG: iron ABC transporter permease [Candidatus Omnitrophota bacterium]